MMDILLNGSVIGTIKKVEIEVAPFSFVMHYESANGSAGTARGPSPEQTLDRVISRLHNLAKDPK